MKKALELRKKLYNDFKKEKIEVFYYQVELEKKQQPIINAIKNQVKETEPNNNKLYFSVSPGPIRAKYLAKGNTIDSRNSFFRLINDQVYLKDEPINFIGDNIIINGEIIPMSENLYKLISRDKNIFYDNLSIDDKEIYYYLANKLKNFNGETGSGGFNTNNYKIFKLIKQTMTTSGPTLEEIKDKDEEEIQRNGLIADPKYLAKRLKLLLAARQAGNKGVENEISDIIKYLHETNKISKKTFISISRKIFN